MRIGIDLGGTKIEIAALDDDGREHFRRRDATPRSYEGTLDLLVNLVSECEKEVGPASVGIGTPGVTSPHSGVMKNANSVWLIGKPLHGDLEQRMGRKIWMANDANCFALSEAHDGAAAGARVVFGVIVGTGTGGGLVVNGRVWTGPNAIAGEWGHNPLPWPQDDERPGPSCYCGKQGCIETFLSGPGLVRDHGARTNENVEPAELVSRAALGDEAALLTWTRYEDRMARSLASLINVIDPDVIVLGGGLSNVSRLYDRVPRLLPRYVFSDRVDTRVVRAKHGDASGVRGAAWLPPNSNHDVDG